MQTPAEPMLANSESPNDSGQDAGPVSVQDKSICTSLDESTHNIPNKHSFLSGIALDFKSEALALAHVTDNMGFVIHDVPTEGSGNCLFSCISFLLPTVGHLAVPAHLMRTSLVALHVRKLNMGGRSIQ